MIKLKNFTKLNSQEIKLIFKWRNHPDISQFMKTKQIDFEEHLRFLKNLHQDSSKKYFLVFQDEQIIGVIDFVNIAAKSCEFGLYAKPNLKGVGQILMNEIKKYAFEILKIKSLKACVFKQNQRALNLYLKNNFYIYNEDEEMFYLELRGGVELNLYAKVLIFKRLLA
ncbi:UDP-4-amino-4,6-dideoxy-N-acetyl-beta-L-altrosamine N-acetyltransferase [Campylobacter jejuni]|uniref:UDP-4-amino-4, 6-dideoxy-N-acetyl-beta-L-altrosamine N-acetyltransferase n=1 Tax=Campylobacter jejuni TaxID=197 RepID=UPI000F808DFB|nr:UDP-4-amino-4,6-dideoxy-N-acetyl-beta-L-altrosamine N-acetyltransferase [Campylobacter jejuni]RTI64641.1 UDP-4-amino-4,6-dideoxy-N-acetyl-beta-L-altrosamine N-acetyltransferase [Campylobacter jejuni]RTI68904.1 UDP-4-amino-4,6-dideoxy-N-acetyl-beta-L-altrosamine N-acetyltransferase [Campylobacter jejuni]